MYPGLPQAFLEARLAPGFHLPQSQLETSNHAASVRCLSFKADEESFSAKGRGAWEGSPEAPVADGTISIDHIYLDMVICVCIYIYICTVNISTYIHTYIHTYTYTYAALQTTQRRQSLPFQTALLRKPQKAFLAKKEHLQVRSVSLRPSCKSKHEFLIML